MKTYAQQLAEEEEEKQKYLMSRGWRPTLGDRCEARYRGRQRFLPCKVVKVHPDDTFDLDYDDGSKEINVKAELIKRPRHAFDYQVCLCSMFRLQIIVYARLLISHLLAESETH